MAAAWAAAARADSCSSLFLPPFTGKLDSSAHAGPLHLRHSTTGQPAEATGAQRLLRPRRPATVRQLWRLRRRSWPRRGGRGSRLAHNKCGCLSVVKVFSGRSKLPLCGRPDTHHQGCMGGGRGAGLGHVVRCAAGWGTAHRHALGGTSYLELYRRQRHQPCTLAACRPRTEFTHFGLYTFAHP